MLKIAHLRVDPVGQRTGKGLHGEISVGKATTGANSVLAGAITGLSLLERDEEMYPEEFYPGLVWIGVMNASARIYDSNPDAFKTWAAAAVSTDDFLQFTVPLDLVGERIFMEVSRTPARYDLNTEYEVDYWVEDVTTGIVLVDLSEDRAYWPPLVVELTHLAGHDIRVSMRTEIAVFGPEGFGDDWTGIGRPSFGAAVIGSFYVYRVALPEPASAWLSLLALAAVGLRLRRGHR